MSGIAIGEIEKNQLKVANIILDEGVMAFINSLIDLKLEKIQKSNLVGQRLVTRTMIVKETSRRIYEQGVRDGFLNPIAGEGRNAQHYVFRTEYDAYLKHLSINRNIH